MNSNPNESIFQTGFFSYIILPTFLTICLFVITLFFLLIPAIEKTILDRKREMIRELVNTAWSVLEELETEEREGKLTRQEAQQRAIDRIELMRYGSERKDYFWITDMHPNMVVHPYRPELNNRDMTTYQDPSGKRLFVECVQVVEENSDGFVEYKWQWKDDETRIVPKLSYVKGFKPWNWIIGTGIYVEDVKEEISSITRWFLFISISITAVISLLLAFVTYQSLTIEQRRRQAESRLRTSREKYKTLVEATTEGLIMIVEGCVFYANQKFLDMLGYCYDEIEQIPFQKLIPIDSENGNHWEEWIHNHSKFPQFPSQLIAKDNQPVDVMLSTSSISFSDKSATILIAKDLSIQPSLKPEAEYQTGEYELLIQNINLGLIRILAEKKGPILDCNQTAATIFGYETPDELHTVPFIQLIHDEEEYNHFLHDIHSNRAVIKQTIQLRRKGGAIRTVLFSAIPYLHEKTNRTCFDALIEDITDRLKIEQEKEDLIAELQTSHLSMNQPIRHSIQDAVSCPMNLTIQQAADLMTKHRITALLIESEPGEVIGIVTDRDIRERVLSERIELSTPVVKVMSAPLIAVSEQALVYEAALQMQKNHIQHLVVKDSTGSVSGMITDDKLLQFQHYSSAILMQKIENSSSIDEIVEEHKRLPVLVNSLIESGANAQSITRTITTVSDTILNKVTAMVLEELGTPPAQFALVALGSEGREEQTLFTDQDNAILFEDVSEEKHDEVQAYFLDFGKQICTYLNRVGYAFCQGNIMAMNSQWCQPVSVWKQYFTDWIQNADPQALLDLKIFFDYRCMVGEENYVKELSQHIHTLSRDKAAFYHHLAANTLMIKPPLGMFGNIVAKSKDGRSETFDIKEAMLPLVDFARIYALQNQVRETNTLERLQRIQEHGVLTKAGYNNALHSYECLMQIRLKHQAEAILSERKSDNQIHPKSLTAIEQAIVKKALSHISDLQTKMNYDFTGTVS